MEHHQAGTVFQPELNIGSVIGRALDMVKENPFLFLSLGAIAVLPLTLIELILPVSVPTFVNMIVSALVTAAVAYAAYMRFLNKVVTVGEALTRGLENLGPLSGVAFVTTFGTVLGLLLLVVPGIILACMWVVAIPVCSVERLGVIDSLKRSYHLTQGYRMKIFLLCLAMFLVLFVLAFAAAMTMNLGPAVEIIVSLLLAVVVSVFTAVYDAAIAVIYYDLRSIKEGLSLESLAEIFD